MTGFEPATPTSRTWCATKLRYIPLFSCQVQNCRFGRVRYPSPRRILNPSRRQSATSRYLVVMLKTIVFNGCAPPLVPSPENQKLILRFDFLPSPTKMMLWARGKMFGVLHPEGKYYRCFVIFTTYRNYNIKKILHK